MIVVERQHVAGRIGDFQHRVQRGLESPRRDFRHDRLAGTALELEHIPLIRPIDAPVHDDGQLDLLGGSRGVVGLLVKTIRQRIQSERHAVGNEALAACGQRIDARPGV